MKIEEITNIKNATFVDVRSVEEFEERTISGAINIPLHTIPVRLQEFKSMKQPVICFCRSGARSYQAMTWLKKNGIDVIDGGGIGALMSVLK